MNDKDNNKIIQSENNLKLGDYIFELNREKSFFELETKENKIINCNLECHFRENYYKDISVSPFIEINNIKVDEKNANNLIGTLLVINDVTESYDREDSFYLFESEPFVNYKIEILEINDINIHLKISGIGIVDGYSKPYKEEEFIADVCIPTKYSNDENVKEEQVSQNANNSYKKDKKTLISITVYGIICIILGFVFINEMIAKNQITYLFASIIMFAGGILVAICIIGELFPNIFKKNTSNSNIKREELVKKLKNKKATKDSWKIKAMTTDVMEIDINISLSKNDKKLLNFGHIPHGMEEHWFMYVDFEDNSINYYRSWSGVQIYKAYYREEKDNCNIYKLIVNNNKKEYDKQINSKEEIEQFRKMIVSEINYHNEEGI